ncbi:g408 [Coccomyxa viridis]|uniref:Mediator of RNA polymerase II transcription subunit 31 n=1 Tax=Coccomyxa viridis TaxID=1274662 RepID=A0ABP1FM99_9CHLO
MSQQLDSRERFLLDLEFVNALASPQYLQHLVQARYMDDQAFIGYLRYLQYWHQPQYAKYIIYPHSLHFLDMLQRKDFRAALCIKGIKELIESQQFHFWQHKSSGPSEAQK